MSQLQQILFTYNLESGYHRLIFRNCPIDYNQFGYIFSKTLLYLIFRYVEQIGISWSIYLEWNINDVSISECGQLMTVERRGGAGGTAGLRRRSACNILNACSSRTCTECNGTCFLRMSCSLINQELNNYFVIFYLLK